MSKYSSTDRPLILLMGIIAGLFLLAALGLFLIQDTSAPLPWEKPTHTATLTPTPPPHTETSLPTLTTTNTPTSIVSYTPHSATATSETSTPTTLPTTETPTPLPSTNTSTPFTATTTATITDTPAATAMGDTATPTETSIPSDTPTPTATFPVVTTTPTPTGSSTNTTLTGRVLVDGTPAAAGVVLQFESQQAGQTNAITDANGQFTIVLAGSTQAQFNLIFEQDQNTQLYPGLEIASWAWLEGFIPPGGLNITLPDLEISLNINSALFGQLDPADGASIPLSQASPTTPLSFNWNTYPEAAEYWVDLHTEDHSTLIWQSSFTPNAFTSFDGELTGGGTISAGSYWWSVGAWVQVDAYKLWVYGQPRAIIFTP